MNEYEQALTMILLKLEDELVEHDAYYRKVVNDECAPDEVHCTCVPALRDKIDRLEDTVAELLAVLVDAIETIEYERHPHRGWHYQAREAIRKASQ